jgi:hypothetical protein
LAPKFQQDRHGDASNRRKMRGDVEIEFLVNRAREATRTIYARAKDEQHLCFDALYNISSCFLFCCLWKMILLLLYETDNYNHLFTFRRFRHVYQPRNAFYRRVRSIKRFIYFLLSFYHKSDGRKTGQKQTNFLELSEAVPDTTRLQIMNKFEGVEGAFTPITNNFLISCMFLMA